MKWTIAMTQEELKRKTIIEQAIDKRISQKEGAGKLGTSERHFRRLLARYRKDGDIGLVSRQRGKPGNRKLGEEKRQAILEFIADPLFHDFGPTLLKEKLEEAKGIVVCKETLRQVLIEEGRYQPRIKKKKKAHPLARASLPKGRTGANRRLLPCLAGRAWGQSLSDPVCG